MATVIRTHTSKIFVDPSAALAPVRYGLPPHKIELKVLEDSASRIESELKDTDIVVITHYHYDHHDPGFRIPIDSYVSKQVLVKNPVKSINVSQKIRASRFLKKLSIVGAKIQVADGQVFQLGGTKITFSHPVPHGNSSRLGFVLMLRVEEDDDVVSYSSDVEGPLSDYAVDFMCGSRLAVVDGPPLYLVGRAYSHEEILRAKNNLAKLTKCVGTLVVDHHLMRDLNYLSLLLDISRISGKQPISAAELIGLEPNLLEARRRELYGITEEEQETREETEDT